MNQLSKNDYELMTKLVTASQEQVKHIMSIYLKKHYSKVIERNKYLIAAGDIDIALVAHLDTVHKNIPSIICYSRDNNYIMSPQGIGGDDRCGVFIILSLLRRLDFKPYILFTMGEEVGCVGAKAFVKWLCDDPDMLPELKFIVEYDRKGNKDCVFYNCGNAEFEKFVEGFGFKTALGSSSDIKVIAPELGAAAVNLSSGYYNPHTEHEYVCMSDMNDIINASVNMLTAECEPFKYIEKPAQKKQLSWFKGGGYNHNYNANNGWIRNYKQVRVTILPKNSVYIKATYGGTQFENLDNEVAVDEFGNYYRFFKTYKDWERTYVVEPMFKDNPPLFNAKKSCMIDVYHYTSWDY